MDRLGRDVGFAVLVATAAVVGVLASVAFPCTNLATINLSTESAHPGDTIALTGTSFPVPRAASGQPPTPVEIHWKSADGLLLATVVPDRSGSISATFAVPESAPGTVVIVATQRRVIANPSAPDAPPSLLDEFGTPARTTLRVLAPGERATPLLAEAEYVPVTTDTNETALIVLLVLSGAVALSLFGGGVIAFLHQVRVRSLLAQPWREW